MGGIAVHVQQLHRALERRGITCRVLNIGKGDAAADGVLPGQGYRRYTRELFRHAAEGWTLHLHTSGNNPRAWTVATSVAVAGQMFGTPTVVTVHSGLVPQRFPTQPGLRRRAQVALLGYSHVLTVSDPVKEALLDIGLRPDRVSMFPAFCAGEVRPGDDPPGLREARMRRRPLVAAAHHPSPVYGRALVMEAVGKLAGQFPGIGLCLFGPGTGSAEYRADAERLGVADLLEDLGELEHTAALAVISRADVFVRPTTADGDSVSVREALALAVRCVATDVAYRPPGTLVCRAGDPDDLAAKIRVALFARPQPVPQPDAPEYLDRLYRALRRSRRRVIAAGRATRPA
jgi:glycogen(starch) synthase